MTHRPIPLREKLAAIDEFWQPKIVGEYNGDHLKLAKLDGEFVWHRHPDTDELFLVVEGRLASPTPGRHRGTRTRRTLRRPPRSRALPANRRRPV